LEALFVVINCTYVAFIFLKIMNI